MSDDPYIDFDGDGEGDTYETEELDDGTMAYTHFDEDGNVDAIALDQDGDGLIDALIVDTDGDGELDAIQEDVTGDGIMDTETAFEAVEDEAPEGVDTLLGTGLPTGESPVSDNPFSDDPLFADDSAGDDPMAGDDPFADNPVIPNPFVN